MYTYAVVFFLTVTLLGLGGFFSALALVALGV